MLLIVYVQMLFIFIASFLFYKYMASLTLVLFCHYGGIVVKVKKKRIYFIKQSVSLIWNFYISRHMVCEPPFVLSSQVLKC